MQGEHFLGVEWKRVGKMCCSQPKTDFILETVRDKVQFATDD